MFLTIQDKNNIERADLKAGQLLRIDKSRKRYAVIHGDTLHLVNNLDRLIYDTLKDENRYSIDIYQLR
jgi:hypothetical protein